MSKLTSFCFLFIFFFKFSTSSFIRSISCYVTERHGETTQFFLNLPFGETMAEQMTGVYDNPYKFNAKELDAETGLYYYGARYYNPRISIWYGVDPLAEKMPSWSPYVYTLNNPVKYIDPTGMIAEDPDPPGKKGGVRFVLNIGDGADMQDAARTRMKEIRKNYPNDNVSLP